jgi:hypothetical protein
MDDPVCIFLHQQCGGYPRPDGHAGFQFGASSAYHDLCVSSRHMQPYPGFKTGIFITFGRYPQAVLIVGGHFQRLQLFRGGVETRATSSPQKLSLNPVSASISSMPMELTALSTTTTEMAPPIRFSRGYHGQAARRGRPHLYRESSLWVVLVAWIPGNRISKYRIDPIDPVRLRCML